MPNVLDSAHGEKVVKGFAKSFENNIVLPMAITRTSGSEGLDPSTGETYYKKRNHQHKAVRTPDGDLTGQTADAFISGRYAITKQDYITVEKEWTDVEQALEMDEFDGFMDGIADQMITTLETSLGAFMLEHAGLTHGTPGQPLSSVTDISGAGALMRSIGVPMAQSCYIMNPYAEVNLAGVQQSINNPALNSTAWQNATVTNNVGGLAVKRTNSLTNYVEGELAGESGTVSVAPTMTYEAVKDTMIGSIVLEGLTPSTTNAVRKGDTITLTGSGADARSYININTRKTFIDGSGQPVNFRFTVTADADTDGTGAVTVQVTCPPIFETAAGRGAYNNISAAIEAGDAFTIEGSPGSVRQPNLFFAKSAFVLDTVALPKLEATDASFKSKSGFQLRVSRGSDLRGNKHIVRFDMLPGFGCANPLMAGRGYGA